VLKGRGSEEMIEVKQNKKIVLLVKPFLTQELKRTKVDAVVKPRVGEVDKVSDRNGHHIIKELGPERPHGSVKSGNFGHCVL